MVTLCAEVTAMESATRYCMFWSVRYSHACQYTMRPSQVSLESGEKEFDGGNKLSKLGLTETGLILEFDKAVIPFIGTDWSK